MILGLAIGAALAGDPEIVSPGVPTAADPGAQAVETEPVEGAPAAEPAPAEPQFIEGELQRRQREDAAEVTWDEQLDAALPSWFLPGVLILGFVAAYLGYVYLSGRAEEGYSYGPRSTGGAPWRPPTPPSSSPSTPRPKPRDDDDDDRPRGGGGFGGGKSRGGGAGSSW